MKNNNHQEHKPRYIFGFTEFFSKDQKYGHVAVPGINKPLVITGKTGPRFIGAGVTEPYITADPFDAFPRKMDELVLEVETRRGRLEVVAWGAKKSWEAAKAAIAARPIYRVCRENQFMHRSEWDVPFIGTLEQMIALCPRDGKVVSTVDQFAPVYVTGPITALNRFELKTPKGHWHPCEDHRPLPEAVLNRGGKTVYRIEEHAGRRIANLALGTLDEIAAQFVRNGKDKLAKYEGENAEATIIWYRHEKPTWLGEHFTPEGVYVSPDTASSEWVDVASPLRTRTMEVTAPATSTTNTTTVATPVLKGNQKPKPVPMPRSVKTRDGFRRVEELGGELKSFAALDRLVSLR